MPCTRRSGVCWIHVYTQGGGPILPALTRLALAHVIGRWKAVYEASTTPAESWETAQRLRRKGRIMRGMASAVRGRVCAPGLWAEDAWEGVQGADA